MLNMYYYRQFIFILFVLMTSLNSFAASDSPMILTKATFAQLSSWQEDDHSKALHAFQRSCADILKRDPGESFSSFTQSGLVRHWQTICLAANKIHKWNKLTVRQFFETWFDPYYVSTKDGHEGLFTGYYLPLLHGHLHRSKRYNVPIYGLPNDLVKVDLGLFSTELAGKKIVGQLKDNKLSLYPDRSAIEKKLINRKAHVLAWSEDPVDVYFAHIQGSAVVQLPNKHRFVIGYAGSNGRPYTSVGKILIDENQLTKQTVSMQSIRTWLAQHPKQAKDILNRNASYVFFKVLKDRHPLGTEEVPLTPERSLAIDNRYIPFGAPVWLSTTIPANNSKEASMPFHHLLIAQDTGGAIKGVVRGDVYWGTGAKAAFIAGHMKSPGEYWMLLPHS